MEQSTAYLIMILLPIIPWFLKITISYKIHYKTPKLNVEKFYRKNKTSYIKRFFYTDLKRQIQPFVYYANFSVGCVLILSILLSVLYLFLAIIRYELSIFVIQYIATYITLIVSVILLVFGTIELFDDKKR